MHAHTHAHRHTRTQPNLILKVTSPLPQDSLVPMGTNTLPIYASEYKCPLVPTENL